MLSEPPKFATFCTHPPKALEEDKAAPSWGPPPAGTLTHIPFVFSALGLDPVLWVSAAEGILSAPTTFCFFVFGGKICDY